MILIVGLIEKCVNYRSPTEADGSSIGAAICEWHCQSKDCFIQNPNFNEACNKREDITKKKVFFNSLCLKMFVPY